MSVELRPKLVGAKVTRKEDPRLLSGEGSYVDDKKVVGIGHLAFRRSDYSHAKIKSIDYSAALEMPGIIGVFCAEDIEGEFTPLRAASRMKNYHDTVLPILAKDKVRFVGEAVVVVVAESRYLAEDALDHIQINYEPLPVVIDPEVALTEKSALLHEEAGTNILAEREFSRGDVSQAFGDAAFIVKDRFRFHRKSSVAMEPRTYLAEYDKGRKKLTLNSSTQVPGIIRDALVELMGLKGNQVRVHAPDVGGGFGGKTSLYPEEMLVCILARKLRRPIKWTSDRLEDLISTTQAFDEIVEAEIAFDTKGNILGMQAEVIGDTGAYSIYPWTVAIEPVQVVSFLPGPYRMPNYRARVRSVATSKAPTGPYRGVGRPISTFVTERLMDMAARKMSIDPAEIRRRNYVRAEEFPYKTGSGIVWDRSSFRECLDDACEEINYLSLRKKQSELRAEGRWFGIGIASYAELTGIGSRISAAPGMPINTGVESATITMDSSGAVSAAFGVASHGQGLETTLAQVVGDELGANIDDISIIHGDTDANVHGTGTYASRSTVLAGGAAILASNALKEKITAVAAHLLEIPQKDVEIMDSQVSGHGTNRSLTFKELATAYYSSMGTFSKEMRETIGDLEATKAHDPFFGTTTTSTHIVVVEIDPDTFKVDIQQYVVAEDCGRVINPLIVDGQVHGGVAQGIGAALYEEIIYDRDGQIQTANLADYLLPTATEVPSITVLHLENELPSTLGGFRGMGEGGTIGAPAAIANAVSDALYHLNINVNELPVTPERLFQLVRQSTLQQKEN